MENKVKEHVLSVLQKAFDKGQQGDMDTAKMIQWLEQELQSGIGTRGKRFNFVRRVYPPLKINWMPRLKEWGCNHYIWNQPDISNHNAP